MIEIEKQVLPYLERKLRPLQRKAKKLGLSAITWKIGSERTEIKPFCPPAPESADEMLWKSINTRNRTYTWIQIEIHGESPVIADWQFVAKIEQFIDGKNLVHTAPDFDGEIPEKYHTQYTCEHCHMTRRRKDTFIVRHAETGEYKQVGRQCLKDFLGYNGDPTLLGNYFAAIAEVEKLFTAWGNNGDDEFDIGYGFKYDPGYTIEAIMGIALRMTRTFGYTSGKQAREQDIMSTGGMVREYLCLGSAEKEKFHIDAPHEDDSELIEKTIQWFSEQDAKSDYIRNIQLMVDANAAQAKHSGYIASMIPVYQRAMREVEKAKSSVSVHFGTIGRREIFILRLESKHFLESEWGVTVIHRMRDERGNVAIWFAPKNSDMTEGESYTVKATVKKHDEYNGVAQTGVNRLAIQA